MRAISRDLRTLFSVGSIGAIADGTLLERFIAGRDEAAFEALVVRHGPMVWGVCRRVLGSHHDAEDAFQATFVVLARKAGTILRRESLASWLYAVAYQTARKARAMAARRRTKERLLTEMPEPSAVPRDVWLDVEPILDDELNRLPEVYRSAIVLCDLEGKSRREAAHELGWPEGTLSSRLARGRGMLARRLARHGLVLSGGAIAAVLSETGASASVASALVDSTVKAAASFAAGHAAAGGLIRADVATLAKGVLKTMLVAKLKVSGAAILALGLLGAAIATAGPPGGTEPAEPPPGASAPQAGAPRQAPVQLEFQDANVYLIERVDRDSRFLIVQQSGPPRYVDRENTILIGNLRIKVDVPKDVRVLVRGEAASFEQLRPGLRARLWIDRNPAPAATATRKAIDKRSVDRRKMIREAEEMLRKHAAGAIDFTDESTWASFGVVTRIELLADDPRQGGELKLDASVVLRTLKEAVENEFDAALLDEPFERFWRDALAKLHHTDLGDPRFTTGARDCKTCHTSAPRLADPTAHTPHTGSTLRNLTAQQREDLVTSIAIERSMQGIRTALDAHRKLVPDRKAAVRALDGIEKAIGALKSSIGAGQETTTPPGRETPAPDTDRSGP